LKYSIDLAEAKKLFENEAEDKEE